MIVVMPAETRNPPDFGLQIPHHPPIALPGAVIALHLVIEKTRMGQSEVDVRLLLFDTRFFPCARLPLGILLRSWKVHLAFLSFELTLKLLKRNTSLFL